MRPARSSSRRRRLRHPPFAHGRLRAADRSARALVRTSLRQRRRAARLLQRVAEPRTTRSSPSSAILPRRTMPRAQASRATCSAWRTSPANGSSPTKPPSTRAPPLPCGCPTWPNSTATTPTCPIARFGNSYSSGLSDLAPEKNLQFDLGPDHAEGEGLLRRPRLLRLHLGLHHAGARLHRRFSSRLHRRAQSARPQLPLLSRRNSGRISSPATSTPTRTRPDTST